MTRDYFTFREVLPPDLHEVSLHEDHCLGRAFLVEYEDEQRAVVSVHHGPDDAPVAHIATNDRGTVFELPAHPRSELGDHAVAARQVRPVRAFELPDGRIHAQRDWGWVEAALMLFIVTGLVGLGGWMLQNNGAWLVVGLLTFVAGYPFIKGMPRGQHQYVVDGIGWSLRSFNLSAPGIEDTSVTTIEAVKAEYGALLTEVIQRIEIPALFDVEVPTTREFTRLMARWDDDRERLRADERMELAAQVRVAFDAARAHAQRVGMDHLPRSARRPARRALKALRLAADPHSSAAERQAALAKANEILSSLMLYYLPRVDELPGLIAGRTPKALPGRLGLEG